MVGRVEASSGPSQNLPPDLPLHSLSQQQQQSGGLISVGDMIPTADYSLRSRHSASFFSTHVALQSAGLCSEGSGGGGGHEVRGSVSVSLSLIHI